MKTNKIPSRTISARANVRAYVIAKGKRTIAQIHILFPRDGAGTLRAECWHSDSTLDDGKRPRFQGATASGYGYDKEAAALAGMVIDGHKLAYHCGETKSGVWPRDAKAPRGWYFCNWSEEKGGYTSLHKHHGIRYLQEIGYSVTQVF